MPFSQDSEVVVKQLDDENWEIRATLRYAGTSDSFEVAIGQGTAFASVPRPFVWFLPRYGSYTMAAILHDYLWRERAAKGEMDWIDADGLFRRAMRELRVPFLRRWIMWAGRSLGGIGEAARSKEVVAGVLACPSLHASGGVIRLAARGTHPGRPVAFLRS